MDAQRFDHLVRALSHAGSRRGLLGLLTALPVVSSLSALLGNEESAAKDRRRRRKQRHKRRTGKQKNPQKGQRKGKHKKKPCQAESAAQTCAGKCAQVVNNCQQAVDCGPCACNGPCPVCQSCDAASGACAPDPGQQGQPCGETRCDGGTFTPRGACASGACVPGEPVSCAPYVNCAGDACADSCQNDDECAGSAHCNGQQRCVGDSPNGLPCAHGGNCQSGNCVNDVCCASASCPQCHACDVPDQEGSCAAAPNGTVCDDGLACTTDDVCTAGVCGGSPVVCNACQIADSCDPNTGSCQTDPAKQHLCADCPTGQWCEAGACASIQATVTVLDCDSRCSFGGEIATNELCGQTVTCPTCTGPACDLTGCFSANFIPDGPAGASWYCSTSSWIHPQVQCTPSGNECPSDRYCAEFSSFHLCVAICPF